MNFKKSILGLIDSKTVSVLEVFIKNPNKEYCLNEVAEISKIPIATSHRILRKLIKLNLIQFNKIKTLRLYKLNQSEAINYLNALFEDSEAHINEFVESIIPDINIQKIIQYGKEAKDRINLLVIGHNIDPEPIKITVFKIKEKYDVVLNTLILEPDQYEQMAEMGLYSGKKNVLFIR
jgi:predicted transcriptional regulator